MQHGPTEKIDDAGEETGFWMAALGAFCLASSMAWFFLRDTNSVHDPFVGAEGLLFGGVTLIVIGLLERRRAYRSRNQ